MYLSVIIPAYNEEHRIRKTLTDVDAYLRSQSYRSEIIVVDDGSTDRTAYVVWSYMKKIPNMRLVRSHHNKGKGNAVRRGMQYAAGRFQLFMDADNSVTIDHVSAFLHAAQRGYDIVIGSIHLQEAEDGGHSAPYRRLLSSLSKHLIRLLAGLGVSDTQRGFKLFTKEAAGQIFSRQTIERYGFDIELLTIARKEGFQIKELPVFWDNPTGSHIGVADYIATARELLKIKRNLLLRKYEPSYEITK